MTAGLSSTPSVPPMTGMIAPTFWANHLAFSLDISARRYSMTAVGVLAVGGHDEVLTGPGQDGMDGALRPGAGYGA